MLGCLNMWAITMVVRGLTPNIAVVTMVIAFRADPFGFPNQQGLGMPTTRVLATKTQDLSRLGSSLLRSSVFLGTNQWGFVSRPVCRDVRARWVSQLLKELFWV